MNGTYLSTAREQRAHTRTKKCHASRRTVWSPSVHLQSAKGGRLPRDFVSYDVPSRSDGVRGKRLAVSRRHLVPLPVICAIDLLWSQTRPSARDLGTDAHFDSPRQARLPPV